MRHADAELSLWLANDRIERHHREAALARQLPSHAPVLEVLRRRAGEALIEAGRRLLPAPRPGRPRVA